jgi:hypothetical protein
MLFTLHPQNAAGPNAIPPGLYSFIQEKAEPRFIYLMFTTSYVSLHAKQANYVGLSASSDALLSAGELVIGANGQVSAWSFRTGYFFERLGLSHPVMGGSLMQAVGLPEAIFYDADDWIRFNPLFKDTIKSNGRMDVLREGDHPSDDAVKANRDARLQRELNETKVESALSGPALKLYQRLRIERDLYESMPPREPVILPRTGKKARYPQIDVVIPPLDVQPVQAVLAKMPVAPTPPLSTVVNPLNTTGPDAEQPTPLQSGLAKAAPRKNQVAPMPHSLPASSVLFPPATPAIQKPVKTDKSATTTSCFPFKFLNRRR